MDWMLAGMDRILCSTMRESAVYWLSIMPDIIPAPLLRNAGSPTLRFGFVRRFRRRSDSTHTIVIPAPAMSMGSDTGEPWKLAPVSVSLYCGRKMGLSPTPLSSISTWVFANATVS